MENSLKHIAIIPDGNRRWAKEKGLAGSLGHLEGAKNTEKLLKTALEMEIPCLSFWGCSIDNVTKRSEKEVKFLYSLFEEYFKRLGNSEQIRKNEVRINFLGEWRKYFPEKLQKVMEEIIENTKKYHQHQLNFMMAYSGIEEMKNAVQKIIDSGKKRISEDILKENLLTKDLPAVDLIIRTGSSDEPHLSSGFMMWDTANAQLHFSKKYYPAFSPADFRKVIVDFEGKERRMGR